MSPLPLLLVAVTAVGSAFLHAALAQPIQSECTNGNYTSPCLTVAQETSRWGITFRSVYSFPRVLQTRCINDSRYLTDDTVWTNLTAYQTGANVNKTVFPTVFPRMIAFGQFASQIISSCALPLPYSVVQPPATSNPTLQVYPGTTTNQTWGPVRAVLWWHEAATPESILQHHMILRSTLLFHYNRLPPPPFTWASWTDPRSTEYYNEIWVNLEHPPLGVELDVPISVSES